MNRFGASPDVAARFALKHMGIDPKDNHPATSRAAVTRWRLRSSRLLRPTTVISTLKLSSVV